mgnify:CR=1 FL=1
MGGNIPKAQTHTIQTDNLGRHVVRKNRLALFKDLRTKAAVTILRSHDINLAGHGFDTFAATTIPLIAFKTL